MSSSPMLASAAHSTGTASAGMGEALPPPLPPLLGRTWPSGRSCNVVVPSLLLQDLRTTDSGTGTGATPAHAFAPGKHPTTSRAGSARLARSIQASTPPLVDRGQPGMEEGRDSTSITWARGGRDRATPPIADSLRRWPWSPGRWLCSNSTGWDCRAIKLSHMLSVGI